jgi:spermidine dehydrogenase
LWKPAGACGPSACRQPNGDDTHAGVTGGCNSGCDMAACDSSSVSSRLVRSPIARIATACGCTTPPRCGEDAPGSDVCIRLSSLCVRARNIGDPAAARGVEIAYARGEGIYGVKAKACVLACWNMMIPILCPEMPETQKAALHRIIKTPLVYTTVALLNWRAFQRLGISRVTAPGCYHTSFRLNWPVDIGGYATERSPDEPILVHMTRTPCQPGLPEFEQNRAGRAELLATPFETFEREIRSQLGRTLAAGDFDPARDITAITVNRWPHGYAPEWNPLWEEPLPLDQQPSPPYSPD